MSSKEHLINGNDFAFPGDENWVIGGLTKREYFAGLAMQALISQINPVSIADENVQNSIVEMSVQFADKLNAELSK